MSNLQTIEMLCNLVERQASVIHHLAMELEQARCLSEAEQEMVAGNQEDYSCILGADGSSDTH